MHKANTINNIITFIQSFFINLFTTIYKFTPQIKLEKKLKNPTNLQGNCNLHKKFGIISHGKYFVDTYNAKIDKTKKHQK